MLVCCSIEFLKAEWGCLPSFAGSRKTSRVRAMIKGFWGNAVLEYDDWFLV